MEECGRGAAVEQLTARGMVSIPAMGAIDKPSVRCRRSVVSIPAMGGNSITEHDKSYKAQYQSPQWGAIECCATCGHYERVSIPAMGGNRLAVIGGIVLSYINPRNGGAIDR